MTTTTKTTNPVLVEALRTHCNKLSKASRADVKPGLYPIDETIRIVGSVSVGENNPNKSTPQTPKAPQLVAVILGKLNKATRDKILRELPLEFVANNQELPAPLDDAAKSIKLVEQVEAMLKSLRKAKTGFAFGTVTPHIEIIENE